MADTYNVTSTKAQLPALRQLIRNLPSILSGRLPDVDGIAHGFKVRIGLKLLALITLNFNELKRGSPGVDGTKWPPLSAAYLAYGRRFGPGEQASLKKQAGVLPHHRFAPGGKKGLLSKELKKLWDRTYADRLAWYIMRESDSNAKAHAAAIAWIVVKAAGGKTKLDVFGKRQVEILVDTGRGAGSLSPGILTEQGPAAFYGKPNIPKGSPEDQEFNDTLPDGITVGTNVGYMGAHHRGRKVPKRRLWPEEIPAAWWQGILGEAISGLVRITDLFRGSRPL